MCTVKCDNHSATSSCKNYAYNTLLMLTEHNYALYYLFFIRKFLLQKVASVCYIELQFKKFSVDPVIDNNQVYVLIKPVSFSTLQNFFLSHYPTIL